LYRLAYQTIRLSIGDTTSKDSISAIVSDSLVEERWKNLTLIANQNLDSVSTQYIKTLSRENSMEEGYTILLAREQELRTLDSTTTWSDIKGLFVEIPDYSVQTSQKAQWVTTTIIEEGELQKFITIYPNPAQDKLYITQNYGENVHIKIMDMQGKTVMTTTVLENSVINKCTIYKSKIKKSELCQPECKNSLFLCEFKK
jgi:hypothetical protein